MMVQFDMSSDSLSQLYHLQSWC